MHKAPFAERIRFCSYQHAYDSFRLAGSIFISLRDQYADLKAWEVYALESAFCTTYFRPFTQKRRELEIPESLVPSHLKRTHSNLRDMRNRVHGHMEFTSKDELVEPFNSLVFRLRPDLTPDWGIKKATLKLDPANGEIVELVRFLHLETGKRAMAMWNEWIKTPFDISPGRWRLNLVETNDDVFVPDQD